MNQQYTKISHKVLKLDFETINYQDRWEQIRKQYVLFASIVSV